MKTVEQPVKVCILGNMPPHWAQSINNINPVAINGRGLPVWVLVQVYEKV